MKLIRLFLPVALLLVSAHRLPAPIQEIQESPTPAPEQSAKPKPKRTVKPKASESSEDSTKPKTSESEAKTNAKTSAPVIKPGPALFAGTWSGTINQGILGDTAMTLAFDADAKSVTETSKVGTFTHAVTVNGDTLTWKSGWLSEIAWTFSPNRDGRMAAVTSKSSFGVNGSAAFRKQ